ncbi:MAG TPA: cytochrome c oxidase subunit II [Candidatus Baltobacteraceae bacterium]|nr:cytochrome c oxidase subunit II [Candidatus Baltobacteraceae bacterium]
MWPTSLATRLRIFPEQASTVAGQVDALFLFLVVVSVFFAGLIFVLVGLFVIKYRRRQTDAPVPSIGAEVASAESHDHSLGALALEVFWTVIPLGITMVIFVWGANLYFTMSRPPANAAEIYVVGKQWMWKLQHPGGQREINELHVPVNVPVKLVMTSEDVIHSFFVPAFRVKRDVVPGKYTVAWFEATTPGEYYLFCAQYCGTSHAVMGGRIVVMDRPDYERWLAGAAKDVSLAEAGEKLFYQIGCSSCHQTTNTGRGPSLVGKFGTMEKLASGESVLVDEAYLRESIVFPQAKIALGYPPIMPTFTGLVTEDGIVQLIAYIKSLAAPQKAQRP